MDLDKLDAKLDRLTNETGQIRLTLVLQHGSLKEHMRRCDALEIANEKLQAEMAPLKTHVAMFSAWGKLFVGLSSMVGLMVACYELYKFVTGKA